MAAKKKKMGPKPSKMVVSKGAKGSNPKTGTAPPFGKKAKSSKC